jgi:cytochrome b
MVFDYLVGLIRFSSKLRSLFCASYGDLSDQKVPASSTSCGHLGHSPAGGAMIVALLIMITATVGTGMANLAADRGEGPLSGVIGKVDRPARVPGQKRTPLLMQQVHETVANITLVLVVLHVFGVVLARADSGQVAA